MGLRPPIAARINLLKRLLRVALRSGDRYVPPLQVGSAGAQCPSGERVISGGGATNVGTLNLTAPFAETSWVVGADNTSTTLTATILSIALCGRIG
jgi:hypothetical protein